MLSKVVQKTPIITYGHVGLWLAKTEGHFVRVFQGSLSVWLTRGALPYKCQSLCLSSSESSNC